MKKQENITIVINITNDGSEQAKTLLNQYIRPITSAHKTSIFDQSNMDAVIKQQFDLSGRETEVLKGMIDGLTNIEIAEKLFISVSTVKYHSRKIFEKLNINTRMQAFSRIQTFVNRL